MLFNLVGAGINALNKVLGLSSSSSLYPSLTTHFDRTTTTTTTTTTATTTSTTTSTTTTATPTTTKTNHMMSASTRLIDMVVSTETTTADPLQISKNRVIAAQSDILTSSDIPQPVSTEITINIPVKSSAEPATVLTTSISMSPSLSYNNSIIQESQMDTISSIKTFSTPMIIAIIVSAVLISVLALISIYILKFQKQRLQAIDRKFVVSEILDQSGDEFKDETDSIGYDTRKTDLVELSEVKSELHSSVTILVDPPTALIRTITREMCPSIFSEDLKYDIQKLLPPHLTRTRLQSYAESDAESIKSPPRGSNASYGIGLRFSVEYNLD
jgi:hypothetical protein